MSNEAAAVVDEGKMRDDVPQHESLPPEAIPQVDAKMNDALNENSNENSNESSENSNDSSENSNDSSENSNDSSESFGQVSNESAKAADKLVAAASKVGTGLDQGAEQHTKKLETSDGPSVNKIEKTEENLSGTIRQNSTPAESNVTPDTSTSATLAAKSEEDGDPESKQNEAVLFLDRVRNRFNVMGVPHRYQDFLDVMRSFSLREIKTEEVVARVHSLLEGNNDLLADFNEFLNDDNMMDNDVKQSAVPAVAKPTPVVAAVPQALPPTKATPAQLPVVTTRAGKELREELAAGGTAPSGSSDNEEYILAVDFVASVRERFQDQPEVYEQFLEVLMAFSENEESTVTVVAEKIQELFGGYPDMVEGFRYFLPPEVRADFGAAISAAADKSEKRKKKKRGKQLSEQAEESSRRARTAARRRTTSDKRRIRRVVRSQSPARDTRWNERQVLKVLPSGERIDVMKCTQVTPGYRLLPVHVLPPRSSRSEMEARTRGTLNETVISVASGSEDSFKSKTMNEHERRLHELDDDRFELDMIIDQNAAAMRALQPIAVEITQWRDDPRGALRLTQQRLAQQVRESVRPGVAGTPSGGATLATALRTEASTVCTSSKSGGKSVLLSDSLQGMQPDWNKRVEAALNAPSRAAIRRLYGKQANEILHMLLSRPEAAVPIVFARLAQKDEDWRDVRIEMAPYWRRIAYDHALRALDVQGVYNDVKEIPETAFPVNGDPLPAVRAMSKESRLTPQAAPVEPKEEKPQSEEAPSSLAAATPYPCGIASGGQARADNVKVTQQEPPSVQSESAPVTQEAAAVRADEKTDEKMRDDGPQADESVATSSQAVAFGSSSSSSTSTTQVTTQAVTQAVTAQATPPHQQAC